MPLFEAIFFDTQKSWLTNGFTTLVGFQGTDLKIAGAVLYPKSSKNFPNHLILIVARRVSQTNACIWFIIRSRKILCAPFLQYSTSQPHSGVRYQASKAKPSRKPDTNSIIAVGRRND